MELKRALLMVFSALTFICIALAIVNVTITKDLGKVAAAEFFAIFFLLLALITMLIDTRKIFPKIQKMQDKEEKIADEGDFAKYLKENAGKEVSDEFDDFIKERDRFDESSRYKEKDQMLPLKKDYINELNMDIYNRDQEQLRKDIQEALQEHKKEIIIRKEKPIEKAIAKKPIKKTVQKIQKKDEPVQIKNLKETIPTISKNEKKGYAFDEIDEDKDEEENDVSTFKTSRPTLIIGDSSKNLFHKEHCEDAITIGDENYVEFGSISEAILKNYNYCKKCIK